MAFHIIPLASCLLILYAPAAFSTAYQWTDDEGQVHFSQTPPADAKATEIELPKFPAAPVQQAPQTTTGPHTNAQAPAGQQPEQDKPKSISEQIEDEKAQAKIEAENKKRLEEYATNCKRAKKYLAQLNSKVRIRLTDLQGNMRILTPDEKQEQIETTERAIEFYCNPPQLDTGSKN